MDTVKTNQLLQRIKANAQEIQKVQENKESSVRIVFLGSTESGKSSMISSIANQNVIIKEGTGKKTRLEGPGIYYGMKSGTREPTFKVDHSMHAILCDCPGFEDTEGHEQEIINSFVIDSLFNKTSYIHEFKFKILLVISDSEFGSIRGQKIQANFERMEKMFPNPEELKQCLGLVISKGDIDNTAEDYIEMLENYDTGILHYWCQFFKSNLDRVFTFPMAQRSQIGQKYVFKDHEKLKKFFNSNQGANPIHKIVLSEQSTLYIENIKINNTQNIQNTVNNIFLNISSLYRKDKSSYQLNRWIELMKKFNNANIKTSKSFKLFLENNIPCYNLSSKQNNEHFVEMENQESISNFIYKICIKSNDNKQYFLILQEQISINIQNSLVELEKLKRKSLLLEAQIRKENEERRRREEEMRIKEERMRREIERRIWEAQERLRREEERKREEEEMRRKEIEEMRRREEERRRQEEERRRREISEMIRRQEEERRRIAEERRRQEEERRRQEEERRRIEEERRRQAELSSTTTYSYSSYSSSRNRNRRRTIKRKPVRRNVVRTTKWKKYLSTRRRRT